MLSGAVLVIVIEKKYDYEHEQEHDLTADFRMIIYGSITVC